MKELENEILSLFSLSVTHLLPEFTKIQDDRVMLRMAIDFLILHQPSSKLKRLS